MNIEWTPDNIKALFTPFMSTITALLVVFIGWIINRNLERSKIELQKNLAYNIEQLKGKLAQDAISFSDRNKFKSYELNTLRQCLNDLYRKISDEYLIYSHAYTGFSYNRQIIIRRIEERILQSNDIEISNSIKLGVESAKDKRRSASVYLTDELNSQFDLLLSLIQSWEMTIRTFLLMTYHLLVALEPNDKALPEKELSEWQKAFSNAEMSRTSFIRELENFEKKLDARLLEN